MKEKARFQSVSHCIACGADDYTELCRSPDFRYGNGRNFSIVRCRECDLVVTAPQLTWDELAAHYPEDYYAERVASVNPKDAHPSRSDHFFSSVLEPATLIDDLDPGRLLEIGCGTGDVLAYWDARGWDCVGVEPSRTAVEIATDQYDITVHNSRIEDVSIDEKFDLVLLDNVLEHLQDPLSVLSQCRKLLRPGGSLVIEVPNIDSIGFMMFGRYWNNLDVPRHLYHFSPSVLRREAMSCGFEFDRVVHSGTPITLRYSLNRLLATIGLGELGRWVSAILIPLSFLGQRVGRGDRFRIRFYVPE